MSRNDFFLRLTLIFAEVSFIYLLYFFIISFAKGNLLITPMFLFLMCAVLAAANLVISFVKPRIIAIVGINLIIAAVAELLANRFAGDMLFSIPSGAVPALSVILSQFCVLWLIFRSVYTIYKSAVSVYGHFDAYILLTFIIFLALSLADIPLPGRIGWMIAAFLFNLIPLYLKSNAGSKANPLEVWLLVVTITVVYIISNQGFLVSQSVSGTAGTFFDLFSTAFKFMAGAFAGMVLFFYKALHSLGGTTIRGAGSEQTPSQEAAYESIAGPSGADFILQGILWGIGILFIVIIAAILFMLVRMLISRLMLRRQGKSPDMAYNPFAAWKINWLNLLASIKKVGFVIAFFLPFNTGVTVQWVYSQLLMWGAGRRHPREIYETPNDYCLRLTCLYPDLGAELTEITDLFVAYRYSGKGLPAGKGTDSEDLNRRLKRILRRLYLYRLSKIAGFMLHKFKLLKYHPSR